MPSGGPATTSQETDRGSRLGAPFGPLFTGFFEGNFAADGATKPVRALQALRPPSFATNLLIVAATLNWPFTHEASLAIESCVTAPSAKGFALIADRFR